MHGGTPCLLIRDGRTLLALSLSKGACLVNSLSPMSFGHPRHRTFRPLSRGKFAFIKPPYQGGRNCESNSGGIKIRRPQQPPYVSAPATAPAVSAVNSDWKSRFPVSKTPCTISPKRGNQRENPYSTRENPYYFFAITYYFLLITYYFFKITYYFL